MPIPREQFEKGLDEIEYQMLDFLKKNPDNAYNLLEIVEDIGISTNPQGFGETLLVAAEVVFAYGSRLDNMTNKGLIEKKIINSVSYYQIFKR